MMGVCMKKKKKGKFHCADTCCFHDSFFLLSSPFGTQCYLGGKWKVLFAFCKYHTTRDFHFRLRELSQLLPALLLLLLL